MAQNNTIQDMLDLYHNLMDEFKEVHKRTRLLQKENASEIINDIKEMAVERDIGECSWDAPSHETIPIIGTMLQSHISQILIA